LEKGNEKKLASMIEKLLLIVSIDEQIMECDRNIYHRRHKSVTWIERNQIQRRELAGIRGAIKQSLQGDLKSFLGKRDLTAFIEIKKAYDRESPNGLDMKLRLQKAIKLLIPTFGKYMHEDEERLW